MNNPNSFQNKKVKKLALNSQFTDCSNFYKQCSSAQFVSFLFSFYCIFVYLQTWPELGKHTTTILLVIPEQPMNSKLFKMIPIASCHVVKMALSVVLTFVLKYLTNYLYETSKKKYLCPIMSWANLFTKQIFGSNLKPTKLVPEHPQNQGVQKRGQTICYQHIRFAFLQKIGHYSQSYRLQ